MIASLLVIVAALLAACAAQESANQTLPMVYANPTGGAVVREKVLLTASNSTMNGVISDIVNGKESHGAHGTTDLELQKELLTAKVTICAILKNEQLYVEEWLDYHRFLGFDQIHLYDNAHVASTYLAGLSEKYGKFVRVTHFPGLGVQARVYLECIKEGSKSNTWAAFIDIDEFIVLRKHANIKAFLRDVAPDGGSVVLNWSIMGSNGTIHYDTAPVVTRFTLTSVEPDRHVKTIAYLPHAKHPNIHNCYMKPGHPTVDQHGRAVSPNSPFNFGNDREIAGINHYFTKSWEEFKLKRRRGFASNFNRNKEFVDDSAATIARIKFEYDHGNNVTNAVEDIFARDFYLRHNLKPESKHLRRR